jgi:L-iditol 2-dehydrogenase
MKAVVKTRSGAGNVDLIDVPEPACQAQGVKIEVAFTGICGTDIHVLHDRFPNYPPVILGHEFSGTVHETGQGVKTVRAGDRVVVLPSSAVVCGSCEYCRQGYYMFCPIRRGMGHGVNGAFTKFVIVREDQCYKLPEAITLEEAAVTEPFAAALQAVGELAPAGPGEWALLSGPGPIGLLCLMVLCLQGCKVIVAGRSSDSQRLALASELGATVTVDCDCESVLEVVKGKTNGRGVDLVVEAAGAAGSVASCLQAVRPMGRYVQIGIAGKEISANFDTILFKQLRVFGSVGHSVRTWQSAMRLLEHRQVDLTRVITHKLPLSEWRTGFDLCERGDALKVLLYYDH